VARGKRHLARKRSEAMKPVAPSGTKRVCGNCTARFYDLDKRPIVCPKCQKELPDSAIIVS
jgi:uncharacterized protein (TIGR02300 family)